MITIRPATRDELPYLQERLNKSTCEQVDLCKTILHVAESEGQIVGILPVRMWFQAEPLYIFEECTNPITRQRAAIGLVKAMEAWVGDRARNLTGVFSYFFVTKTNEFAALAERWGCLEIYKGCRFFGKDL